MQLNGNNIQNYQIFKSLKKKIDWIIIKQNKQKIDSP